MIIKTSELEDAALDWSVAKVEGIKGLKPVRYKGDDGVIECWLEKDNLGLIGTYSPSRDWQCGGPLIEQHGLCVGIDGTSEDSPSYWAFKGVDGHEATGSAILIAAMRAIVAAELGENVDVPEELIR